MHVRAVYRGSHPIFSGIGRMHCSACGMGFASPMPVETALGEYNASYFSTAHGGYKSNVVAKAFFSGIARLRMAHIVRYIEVMCIPVGNVLELGPGPGIFAKNWLEKYPKTSYMACETDISCHSSLQKMGVTLLESASKEASLVALSMTIVCKLCLTV